MVHVNYYCKTTEGMFIPAELAISKFNLEDGVKDTYHILIDPGNDILLAVECRVFNKIRLLIKKIVLMRRG